MLESCVLSGLVTYARYVGVDRQPLRVTTNYQRKEAKLGQMRNAAEPSLIDEVHSRTVRDLLLQVPVTKQEAQLLKRLLHCLSVFPAVDEPTAKRMLRLDTKLRAAVRDTGVLEELWA